MSSVYPTKPCVLRAPNLAPRRLFTDYSFSRIDGDRTLPRLIGKSNSYA